MMQDEINREERILAIPPVAAALLGLRTRKRRPASGAVSCPAHESAKARIRPQPCQLRVHPEKRHRVGALLEGSLQPVERRQGLRSSPRYPLQSSFARNGGSEVTEGMPAYLKLQSAADGKALVANYQQLGVDQLKVYELMGLQQFQWLSAAAKPPRCFADPPASVKLTEVPD